MKYVLPLLLLAALLAMAMSRLGSAKTPQLAVGGDALSVAFADAKTTISAAMVHKADSYFHGGIDMECPDRHECKQGDCHHEHGHGEDAHHDDEHERTTSLHDPWGWINRHVRAPEKHIHLEGQQSVELMPWLWAAVRADAHNGDAWTTAFYVANNALKDTALARRILDEAKAKNPDSLEVAWTEARFVHDGGKGDATRAERLLEAARSLGKQKCGGRLSELSAKDAELYCYILDRLSEIKCKRGERTSLTELVEEARTTGADTPVVKWMTERAAAANAQADR